MQRRFVGGATALLAVGLAMPWSMNWALAAGNTVCEMPLAAGPDATGSGNGNGNGNSGNGNGNFNSGNGNGNFDNGNGNGNGNAGNGNGNFVTGNGVGNFDSAPPPEPGDPACLTREIERLSGGPLQP